VDLSPVTIVLIAAIFLFAGGVKGLIGVGLPTVSVALLINILPPREAIPLIVLPSLISNIWQALIGGRAILLIKRFWPLLIMACAGTWLGVNVLATADQRLISGLFGAVLTLYALTGLLRPAPPPIERGEVWLTPLTGFVTGLINGVTGSYMMPSVLYLQALGLKKDELVQAMGIFFVVSAAALGISLTGQNVMTAAQASLSAAALLPALIGYYLGQSWREGLSEERFRTVFFIGLLCLGVYTVATRIVL
jgi:uncharacterized membrane protein YfcA